jgi:hypothetical protein
MDIHDGRYPGKFEVFLAKCWLTEAQAVGLGCTQSIYLVDLERGLAKLTGSSVKLILKPNPKPQETGFADPGYPAYVVWPAKPMV